MAVRDTPHADLERLIHLSYIVHSVARQALNSPNRSRVVAMGASGTPTQEVDRVAEAQVLSVLEQEKIPWNVLSEELGFIDRGGDRMLILDPIDGSHNALAGLPFSTISLALGRKTLADVDMGVIHDLDTGTTYWAEKGRGAFHEGRRLTVRPWVRDQEILMVNLGSVASSRAQKIATLGRRIRSLGCASFEIAMVAQGAADCYFNENVPAARNLRVTDIAAAQLLLREAGGGISQANGEPLDVPLDIEARTSVFAWGDPRLKASVLEERLA